jgi:hypothetical protein
MKAILQNWNEYVFSCLLPNQLSDRVTASVALMAGFIFMLRPDTAAG